MFSHGANLVLIVKKTKSGGGGTVPLHLLPVIEEPNHTVALT